MAGGGQPRAAAASASAPRPGCACWQKASSDARWARPGSAGQPRDRPLPLRAAYRVFPPAAAFAARAVRPLDPLVRRVLATRERVQGRALPAASPAERWAFGAASGLAAAVSTSAGAAGRAGWQIRRVVRSGQAAGPFRGPWPARRGWTGLAASHRTSLPRS